MTLSNIAQDYLETLGQISLERYRIQKSSFSHTEKLPKDVEKITSADTQKWIAAMQKKLSPNTIKRVVLCWSRACEQAIEKGSIEKNPFSKVKRPKIAPSKIDPFTKDEIETMLSKATGRLESYLAFAFYTGARCCEILALKWDDIDLDSMTIRIDKSLVDGLVKNQTKTGEDRVVPVFESLVPYIKELALQRESDWVFSERGDHLFGSTSLFGNGKWRKFLADCEVPYRSARHTRHTFATHMVECAARGEIPLKWVSQILGHANLDMTIKVYARFIKDEHLKIDRNLSIF